MYEEQDKVLHWKFSKVEKILSDFDLSLSLYKDSSLISRINRNEDVVLDSFFEEAFKISLQIYEMTSRGI